MFELSKNNLVKIGAVVVGVIVLVVLVDRYTTLSILPEGFNNPTSSATNPVSMNVNGPQQEAETNAAAGVAQGQMRRDQTPSHVGAAAATTSAFTDYSSFASFEGGADPNTSGLPGAPGCYPKQQIQPAELLPKDAASAWAKSNPQGQGDLNTKNFLQAGYHIGIDSIGQSKKNGNLQLRSDPPIPVQPVGPFLNSSYVKDEYRRNFEIGV